MSVPFMSDWEVLWTRLWRLLMVLCLATGFYSCSAKKIDPQVSQAPAMDSADSAQQTGASPMDSKPMGSATAMGQAKVEGSFQVQDFRVFEGVGQTTLRMTFSQPVTQFRHFTLAIPTRFVLDVFGDVKQATKEEKFKVGTSWVNSLKLSTGKGHYRVVVDINSGTMPHFTVEPDDNGLSLIIGPINRKISTKKELVLIEGSSRVMTAAAPSTSQGSLAGATSQASRSSSRWRGGEKEYTGQRISLDF